MDRSPAEPPVPHHHMPSRLRTMFNLGGGSPRMCCGAWPRTSKRGVSFPVFAHDEADGCEAPPSQCLSRKVSKSTKTKTTTTKTRTTKCPLRSGRNYDVDDDHDDADEDDDHDHAHDHDHGYEDEDDDVSTYVRTYMSVWLPRCLAMYVPACLPPAFLSVC